MTDTPGSVLFMCYMNSIRSPMAEGLLKAAHGNSIYVQSCGLAAGELDTIMVGVMQEKCVDMTAHQSRTLDELAETNYDIVIAFTKEAGQAAEGFFSGTDTKIEVWPVPDPTQGVLDVRSMMNNYRAVRDTIAERLQRRFG